MPFERSLEHCIRVALRWIVHIWIVQKFLDSKKHLHGWEYGCEARAIVYGKRRTCLMVIAGFQDFSSSRIDRHTVPDGYTLGWKRGGANLPARA